MSNFGAHHPVWDVYDEYRTARLNVKYHEGLLRRYQMLNFWIELLLAVTAPSSAIAGLWFWNTPVGSYAWKSLGVITAVLALARPLLKLTDRMQAIEETLAGYKALDQDFRCLSIAIHQDRKYEKRHQKRFQELLERKKAVVTSSRLKGSCTKLQLTCEEAVLRELPVDELYIPAEDEDDRTKTKANTEAASTSTQTVASTSAPGACGQAAPAGTGKDGTYPPAT
jgi:hypothetical protein